MDELNHNNPALNGRGLHVFTMSDPDTRTHNSTLIIAANEVNNGTMIVCKAASPEVESDTALLLIQGKVQPV